MSSSNQSATSSRSTAGANGRKLSRYLTLRLRFFCIAGERGSPRIERAPSERGPNSMRPWNQPTACCPASACAVVLDHLVVAQHGEAARRPRSAGVRSRLARSCGPEQRAGHAVARRWSVRGLPLNRWIGGKRRAERAAGVARRRLDPDVVEARRRAEPCRWRRSSAPRRRRGRDFARRSAWRGARRAAARPPPAPPGSRPRGPCGTASAAAPGSRTGSPNSSAKRSLVMVRPVQ